MDLLSRGSKTSQKRLVEKLWRAFFSDPSQWWDHRMEKLNPRYPDFKHKKTEDSLWLSKEINPSWVSAKLAKLAPGAVQSNVFSWNKRLARHVKSTDYEMAIELFKQMQKEGVHPDKFTFVPVLSACSYLQSLDQGKRIHLQIKKAGQESNVYVGNGLVDMYAKCGSIEDAWKVFSVMRKRDVITWNSMIGGLMRCGHGKKALDLFGQMQGEGVEPNRITFAAVLNSCASLGALEEGRSVHEQIVRMGFESDCFMGSCLVNMYTKCGSIEDAWAVFSRMHVRDVVSWTAMIQGYANCGQGLKALKLFRQMQDVGVEPNRVTLVKVLNACASLLALEEGEHIHKYIVQSGNESDIFVGNSLIDMYAKCGSVDDAWRVFDKMSTRSVVSWNAMLAGFATHGHTERALVHFERMCQEGVEVDKVTFASLLSACSHAGLVDEGHRHFESMSAIYSSSVIVDPYHYACLVDIFGRAGRLHEAEDLIKTLSPGDANASVWMSLLGACKVHGNVEMGELAALQVLKLDPNNASGYVLLSNIYAAAGKWDSSAIMKRQRLQRGVKKSLGHTWIMVKGEVHSFAVDDDQHPQITEIHKELKKLSRQMKKDGYLPDTRFVFHNVKEEEKVISLCHHSEKLAIAYGLISTPAGSTLRIFKNLRVCDDCHSVTKMISKIVGRAIIVRDGSRFHHFQDGSCSCKDFW